MFRSLLKARVPRRMRLALGSLAALALVMLTLVGCGVVGEKYIYVEWYTNYFEKYYVRWFNDFEREHADENVRIKFRAMPTGAQQVVYTMLLSHTLSDVIVSGLSTAHLLYNQDALEPVKPGDLDTDDFMPISLKLASKSDGTLVGYPTGAGLRPFMYFSRKSLDEGDTDETQVPETFDEYRAWTAKMFRWNDHGRTVFGPCPDSNDPDIAMERRPMVMIRGYIRSAVPFMLAYVDPVPDADGASDGSIDDFVGGPPSNRPLRFDTPEFVRGLTEYQKWFLPKRTAVADSDGTAMQGFERDVYAGMEGANWIYGEVFNLNFQVTPFPHASGRQPRLYTDSGAQGVARQSKHKKLAVEFAKFLASADAQVDSYYGHGYLPCRFSVLGQAAGGREGRRRHKGEVPRRLRLRQRRLCRRASGKAPRPRYDGCNALGGLPRRSDHRGVHRRQR